MKKHAFCLVSYLFLFLTVHNSNSAVVRCVSTGAELLSALNESANSEEDFLIQIAKGTYNADSGSFVYSSDNASSLTIEGGYNPGCASRDDNPVNPYNTVLDGRNFYQVLALVSTAAVGMANFTIDGITVQNGKAMSPTDGAGIYIRTENGDIALSNSFISNNHANRYAGGVYFRGTHLGDVTVTNNVFENNSGNSHGGAVEIREAQDVTISNNRFNSNSTADYGGAIYLAQIRGKRSINENIFDGNTAGNERGAAICSFDIQSNATLFSLVGNTISGSTNGGGTLLNVYNSSDLMIRDNVIVNNKGGSGIRILEDPGSSILPAKITLLNNIIASNEVYRDYGGGLDITAVSTSTTLTLTNNTIAENSTTGSGGGVRLALRDSTANARIYNNIIWNNSATTSASDVYMDNDADKDHNFAAVELYNNDFNQSPPVIGAGGGFFVADTTFYTRIDPSNLNNINPLFVNTSESNLRLQNGSPCINTGNSLAPAIPLLDIAGQPRIMGGGIDMGAYEALGAVVPVALFSASPLTGQAPLDVTFQDASFGNISSRLWAFGDGATSTEQHPVHTYTSAGSYNVTLTVTGSEGSDSESKTAFISVSLHPPVASAGIDRSIAQQSFTFNGAQSSDPDGSVVSYQWHLVHRTDAAYNQDATGVNPTVSGLHSGFYDVTLTVTDNNGLTGSDTMVLAVSTPWDVGSDGQTGLEEAIHILRTLSGL